MAATPISTLLLLFSAALLLPSIHAQSAPAPAPSGPTNITGILDKAGQYSFFIRLLNETHAADQINNQANNSHDGMTLFAPTDNAFNNLPAGTLNNLSYQQHVQLVLYHTLPRYYSLENFQTVSNPVRTQASGQDGGVWGLNFTTQGNQQVNVSTGIVTVTIYNQLSKDPRIAVYEVDKVLLPREFYETRAAAAPSPSSAPGNASSSADVGRGGNAPSTANPGNGSGKTSVGFGVMSAIWLLSIALLS